MVQIHIFTYIWLIFMGPPMQRCLVPANTDSICVRGVDYLSNGNLDSHMKRCTFSTRFLNLSNIFYLYIYIFKHTHIYNISHVYLHSSRFFQFQKNQSQNFRDPHQPGFSLNFLGVPISLPNHPRFFRGLSVVLSLPDSRLIFLHTRSTLRLDFGNTAAVLAVKTTSPFFLPQKKGYISGNRSVLT